jgi:serine/threonine-protein kinase
MSDPSITEQEERELEPGDLLTAKYEIVRTLGSGGMGVVYEARNLQTHARVAVKLLRKKALGIEGATARFSREARAAGKLRGSHVGRVLDADTTDAHVPFIVMEYYEGTDLRSELKARGTLEDHEACGWILQACAGLAEAHAHGLVHRDVKPGNIFLANESGKRRVRVLDFGISKQLDEGEELTQTMAALGTLGYMAPEQVRDAKRVDHRVDIWALGVVLYKCVTGRLPFEGSPTHVAIAIATEQPATPRSIVPELNATLDAAIMRALEKEPDRRYPDLASFARAIAPFAEREVAREALAQIELHAGPSVEPPVEKRVDNEPTASPVTNDSSIPFRRKPRRAWIAFAAVAAIGLVSGAIALSSREPAAPAPMPVATPSVEPPAISVSAPPPPASTSVSAAVSGSAKPKPVPVPKKGKPKRQEDPDLLP